MQRPDILAISGSTRKNSSNIRLIRYIARQTEDRYSFSIFDSIDTLPHFNPDLKGEELPAVKQLRELVANAAGVMICTPEYVFSLPGSLKNALEWFVSTTLFSGKPVGLITASASGEKGHEELQLVMKTIEARFSDSTTLLIKGIQRKIDEQEQISDTTTIDSISQFLNAFDTQLKQVMYGA